MKIRLVILGFFVLLLLSANAAAKDEWITVRSKNFHLVGNAKVNEIRGVAKKLEQFRHVFGLLFPKISLNDPVGTKVFVFKNKRSFRPFLPKKNNGKPDEGIAGYFLSTEDTNYIVLSTTGSRKDTYETIFHEYVHFLLNSNYTRGDIPPWLHEGLAEYYSTLEVEDDQKVYLANIRDDHLYYLSRSEFIPLRQFFSVDNYSLHQNGDHSRTVFYAQAWALIHYFGVKKQLDRATRFIELAKDSDDTERAFKEAFGFDYGAMESILRNYVKQRKFTRLVAIFKNKLVFEEETQIRPLKESEALADLGFLLYDRREYKEAEEYLGRALALDADDPRANTAMGLIKMHHRKFDDAKIYLEKALSADVDHHYSHYSYAYVLSRENMDENGFVFEYDKSSAEMMRKALRKSISLKPGFIPSYNLLAFINLVTGDRLDESVGDLNQVLSLQPGNERATLTLAQIYLKQRKLDDAQDLANRILNSTNDGDHRSTAKMVLNRVQTVRDMEARNEKLRERYESGENRPRTLIVERNDLTDEEFERLRAEREISMMNQSVLKPGLGENQMVGFIKSIDCDGSKVTYRVANEDGKEIRLTSNGFQNLELLSLSEEARSLEIGCDAKLHRIKGVINYHPNQTGVTAGLLRSVTFVPDVFRIKTRQEIDNDIKTLIVRESGNDTVPEEGDRRTIGTGDNIIPKSVKHRLRPPRDGESRVLGKVKRISCDSKGVAFHIGTDQGSRVFRSTEPQNVRIVMLGLDPGDFSFGCGQTPPTATVVVTYSPVAVKGDSDGKLIALEFVPEGTKLD